MRKFLETYIQKFSTLRSAKNKTGFVPHKPVLLISVAVAISREIIVINKINMSDILSLFSDCWNDMIVDVQGNCQTPPKITTPFLAMATEGFWHLDESKTTAKLDQDLFNYFSIPMSRDKLLRVLFEAYFPNKMEILSKYQTSVTKNIEDYSNIIVSENENSKSFIPLNNANREPRLHSISVSIDMLPLHIEQLKLTNGENFSLAKCGVKKIIDIAKLDMNAYARCSGIGEKYIQRMKKIQRFIWDLLPSVPLLVSEDISFNTSIKHYELKGKLVKAIDCLKIKTLLNILEANLDDILTFPGFGTKARTDLEKIKKRVLHDLNIKSDTAPIYVTEDSNVIPEKKIITNRVRPKNFSTLVDLSLREFFDYDSENNCETIEVLALSDNTVNILQHQYFFQDESISFLMDSSVDLLISRLGINAFREIFSRLKGKFSICTRAFRLLSIEVDSAFDDFIILPCFLSTKIAYVFHSQEIFTYGDLKHLDKKNIKISAQSLVFDFYYSEKIPVLLDISAFSKYLNWSFNNFLNELYNYIPSKRNQEICYSRIVCGMTLAEISTDTGITRERIRQITLLVENIIRDEFELLAEKRSSMAFLSFYFNALLLRYHGVLATSSAIEIFCDHMKWTKTNEIEKFLDFMIKMIPSFKIVDDLIISSYANCISCNVIKDTVILHANNNSSLDKLKSALSQRCVSCRAAAKAGGMCFSEDLLNLVIKNNKINIIIDFESKRIFKYNNWKLSHGSLSEAVYLVVQELERATLNDVVQRLSGLRCGINIRHVHSAISRVEDIVLCNRGEYMLKSKLPELSSTLTFNIANDIEKLAESKLPIYNIRVLFDRYLDELQENGIDSPYLLFEVMKNKGTFNINFLKSPYVTFSVHAHFSVSKLVNDYITDHDEATLDELKELFCDQLGIGVANLRNIISNDPDLLITENNKIIHIDTLNITREQLMPLVDYLEDNCSNAPTTIYKIWEDQKITSKMMGISNSKLLFNVLNHFFSNEYTFRFPRISKCNVRIEGTVKLIDAYVRKQNSYCTQDDLVNFGKSIGYSEMQAKTFIYNPHIQVFRYLTGSVIHKETIGWTPELANQVYSLAKENLENSLSVYRYYGFIPDIINHYSDKLPRLKNDIAWTEMLLRDMLFESGKFVVLGNYKNIYVETNNKLEIKSFGDICCRYLLDEFAGATSLSGFSKFLVRKKLIKNNLTSTMVSGDSRIKFTQHELFVEREDLNVT